VVGKDLLLFLVESGLVSLLGGVLSDVVRKGAWFNTEALITVAKNSLIFCTLKRLTTDPMWFNTLNKKNGKGTYRMKLIRLIESDLLLTRRIKAMDKKKLTETDIITKFILTAVELAGIQCCKFTRK